VRDRQVGVLVHESFEYSHKRYGSPRVWEDLREQDVRVSRKRVVRIMQQHGLRARVQKRYRSSSVSEHDSRWQPTC